MTRLRPYPTWVLQRGPSPVMREIPLSGLSQDRNAASLSLCRKAKPRSKALRATYRLLAQYCSAPIVPPEDSGREDGLLQGREIRAMHLSSKLVTLSACSTGVGQVGEVGV